MLLIWFGRNRRELPWRSNPTPYRVWVAEVMLQQTRVQAVLPFYERFLERFPDVKSLAHAAERNVLAAWAGLGYYARAHNLRRAAQQIVRDFGGRMPRDPETLRNLPGIGRYTAGAICSIAFNQPRAIVDGNVRRLISRLHAAGHRVPERFIWRQAAELVPAKRASDFNQGLMELGALVCVPAKPLCASCPARSLCVAYARGIEDRGPAGRSVKAVEPVQLVVLAVQHRGKTLVSLQNPAEYIPGKLCLPTQVLELGRPPIRAATSLARTILGTRVQVRPCCLIRHSITRRRIVAHLFRVDLLELQGTAAKGYRWVKTSQAERALTSSLYRKALTRASRLIRVHPRKSASAVSQT